MRIAGVPCDFDGSGMYRVAFPFAALNARGHECALPIHHRPVESYLKANAEMEGTMRIEWFEIDRAVLATGCDIVVIQRPVDKDFPEAIRRIKAAGVKVVVETDDWMAHPPEWNPSMRALDPGHNKERNQRVLADCMKLADAVTVSTPFLKNGYRRYNRNIHVIRNYLERSMWEDRQPVYEKSGLFVRVGYMGDAKWHGGDLKTLAGVIGPWLARNPDVMFVTTEEDGDEVSAAELLGVPPDQSIKVSRVPFRSFRLPDVLGMIDIGLVPLADHPFNEGKSHLKGLEYNAMGIPYIAFPTESYRWYTESGVNGFLAKRAKQWVSALDALVAHQRLRHRMGRDGRRIAMMNTIDQHADKWENVFYGVLDKAVA